MDSVSMITYHACGDQRINTRNTDLARTWKAPKGRNGADEEEKKDMDGHLERRHRENDCDCVAVVVELDVDRSAC
jgi:hypothetical protein